MGSAPHFAKAQKQALMYLKIRPRSEHELRVKLKEKKHDPQTINDVIKTMLDYGYLNDDEFTRAWVNYRINLPLGLRRIQTELKQKGIDQSLIDCHIERIMTDYDEESVVRELILKRLKRYKDIEPLKIQKRLYDFLIRKGFTISIIRKVVLEIVPLKKRY